VGATAGVVHAGGRDSPELVAQAEELEHVVFGGDELLGEVLHPDAARGRLVDLEVDALGVEQIPHPLLVDLHERTLDRELGALLVLRDVLEQLAVVEIVVWRELQATIMKEKKKMMKMKKMMAGEYLQARGMMPRSSVSMSRPNMVNDLPEPVWP
jgi:hypothetical protein